jgi:hypothetical protein
LRPSPTNTNVSFGMSMNLLRLSVRAEHLE